MLAFCVASTAMAEDVTYDFVTENGYTSYDKVHSISTTHFTIKSDSLTASGLSQTSISLDDATIDDYTFETDQTFSLSSITIIGRNDTNSYGVPDSDTVIYVYAADSSEILFTGTWVENTTETLTSATDSSLSTSSVAMYTFSFEDDAVVNLDETYTVVFWDTSTDSALTLGLSASQGGDSGFLTYSSGYSNPMTITGSFTASIPEPTTATLSLVALAGLMIRRRRQA